MDFFIRIFTGTAVFVGIPAIEDADKTLFWDNGGITLTGR
jgi:hypothetical protein